MNYVYCIYSGKIDNVLIKFLTSLDKHCQCKILFNYCGLPNNDIESCIKNNDINIINVYPHEWDNKRMYCKIKKLQDMPFQDGDNVFVLDTDLLIQNDIFKVFNNDFDLALTTRHYDYWYQINAGVWAFRYSDTIQKFIKFFSDEIVNPYWVHFKEFQKKFRHMYKLDWWCDQDFLCAVYQHGLPFECKVMDIGYRYNYCPSVEEKIKGSFEKAKTEILSRVGDENYKILHFKGRLKEIMP